MNRKCLDVFLFLIFGLTFSLIVFGNYQVRAAGDSAIKIDWSVNNPGPGRQTHPAIAYDVNNDQILLVWEDGRNDPQNRVDSYGSQANSDIYGRLYQAKDGSTIGTEIAIANQAEYDSSNKYNNEQWPSVSFNPIGRRYNIVWMQIPRPAALGDFKRTTCYDVAYRNFKPTKKELGPVLRNISAYQAPADLIDPWGYSYDWGCQQEPKIIDTQNGITLAFWQDHRQRFDTYDSTAKWVSKDIYGQIIQNNTPIISSGQLISSDDIGRRLPMHQEKVDVAVGANNLALVVWQDERASQQKYPQTNGPRAIYGRFVLLENDLIQPKIEVAIASPVKDGSRLIHPSVAYLNQGAAYLITWSKEIQKSTSEKKEYYLYYSFINSLGQIIKPAGLVNSTPSQIAHLARSACTSSNCLVVYRSGSKVKNDIYIKQLTLHDQGLDQPPVKINTTSFYHSYPTIVSGKDDRLNQQSVFYLAYVDGQGLKLARLSLTTNKDGFNFSKGDVNQNGTAHDRGDVICFITKYLRQPNQPLNHNFLLYDLNNDLRLSQVDVILSITNYLKQMKPGPSRCL